jgi:transglutaminase-like putative cysteine protease
VRLDIGYTTRFRYPSPVRESQNELRAAPTSDRRQQLLHYDVTTAPSSRVSSYIDYWGTRVDTFGIRPPHTELEVVARATVETFEVPPPDVRVALEAVAEPEFRERHLELLHPSPHVDWGPAVAEEARRVASDASDDLLEVLEAIHLRVAGLDYAPGQTYVGVAVDHVFEVGHGVCQDFAHLAVAMYRSLGIPARYVSGYLFAADDATGRDTTVDEIDVQTHAWVEVAVPDAGWLALDPTNAQPVGERHVTIGRGRDYDDVSPFRGAYRGPAAHELSAQVHLRRLPPAPAGRPESPRESSDGGHRERLGLHVHTPGDGALQEVQSQQ